MKVSLSSRLGGKLVLQKDLCILGLNSFVNSLRNIYKDTAWKKEIDEFKELAKIEGKDWRHDYNVPEPLKLNENTKRMGSDIYIAHTVLQCGEEYVKNHTEGMNIPIRNANEVFAEEWVMERLHERRAYNPFVAE